jgi:hypothetical protein
MKAAWRRRFGAYDAGSATQGLRLDAVEYAVSRARTNLPAGELTCALHGSALPEIVGRLERSAAADHAVAEYAIANDRQHFMAVTARLRS